MKKKTNKISKPVKDHLRFLVEEFLEKSVEEIMAKIGGRSDAEKTMWEKLEGSLFDDIFWMDEVDPEDKVGIDFEKLLLEYHDILKPIWKIFREAIFDFKYRIIPEREKQSDIKEKIENDVFSILYEYKDLLNQDSVINWEQFYDIEIKLKVSFDSGHVAFYKRNLDLLNNFLDLLGNVPIYYFARCSHCGKCIILIRSDKRFCHGCAAKKYQKDKWASDPEGMKEKERLRYRELRKKP